MPDEVIEELRGVKDSIAREHGNDVRKLAAYIQGRELRNDSQGALGRPAVDILDEAPVQRLFKIGKDMESHVKDERTSWDT